MVQVLYAVNPTLERKSDLIAKYRIHHTVYRSFPPPKSMPGIAIIPGIATAFRAFRRYLFREMHLKAVLFIEK
jgi:hypothetical protein